MSARTGGGDKGAMLPDAGSIIVQSAGDGRSWWKPVVTFVERHWRRIAEFLYRNTWRVLPALLVAAGVTGYCASSANSGTALQLELDGASLWAETWVVGHLWWDLLFIAAYTALAAFVLGLLWRKGTTAERYRGPVIALAFLMAVADLVEDACIWYLHTNVASASAADGLYAASRIKWFLAGAVGVAVLWQLRRHVPAPDEPNVSLPAERWAVDAGAGAAFDAADAEWDLSNAPKPIGGTDRPKETKAEEAARLDRAARITKAIADGKMLHPEWMAGPGEIGICLSGGGIRSAAFSMGAVTGLSMTTMSKARYIAAASGGAYTASAMRRHYRSASREMPFAEGSPELRRLRARSSFLFLDGRDGRFTVGRAIATVIFNALILYLVMFAVARPVGWAISYIHPELRAMSPMIDSIELDDLRANVAVDRESADVGADCGGDEAAPATYWTFEAKDPGTYSLAFRLAPNDSIDDDTEKPSFPLMHATKGLIRACGSRLEIVRQPTLRIAPPEPFTGKLKIAQQPTYKIAGQSDFPPTDASVRAEIKVDEKLEIEAKTDAVDRPNISIESWMWIVLGIAAVMMFLAYALPWTVWRGRPDATMRQGHWITFWTAATIVWGAVMVVVPWLAQELPRLFDDLPGLLAGAKAPATSDITVAITWVVTMLTSGGLAKIVISRLNKPAAKVKRASRFTLKLASYVLLTLSGLIVIVVTANQGAMNRPGGLGLGSGAEGWSGFFVTSDLGNWAAAVVVLWALQRWVATHVWSLHPLYRDRLAAAFIRTAADAKAAPKVRKQMRFADAGHVPDEWPELLVCCAANLNDLSGEIPAKRWADSFVFSATHVGGPTITYMPTATYEQRLSNRRKKDLSVESVVAVSGAAFSPAMGNQDFGPIGGLFAALNLRLGIWMPTPLSVRHTAVADGWDDNPGWSFLIRELFGRFSYRDGFVYTSDGGHWENLGLVELIRHGCNEIIVISAAGDSVDYFPTLGDAIALAREQTRVDIQIDPSALRPRRGEELPKNGRQQLREVDGSAKSQPMAADPYTVGWFTRPNGERGIVLFVEAALTKDTPWDVHAFGEGHAIFPDHPTTNQFYNHRTFEAYRVLGEYQARTAVASDKWQVAQAWRASTEPARDGPFRATPAPPAAPTKVEFTNPLIVHER